MGLQENSEIMGRLRDVLLELYRAGSPTSTKQAIIEKGLQLGALHLRFTVDLGADAHVSCIAVGNKDGREQPLFRFGGPAGPEN